MRRHSTLPFRSAFVLVLVALGASACASSAQTIPGTEVASSSVNRELIERIEEYRTAVERKDAAALLLMAHEGYWEDSGTAQGGDDYGYEGLKEVLARRFQDADGIRYALNYKRIRRRGCDDDGGEACQAFIDVIIDASFTTPDARGEAERHDMRDHGQFVLEWDGEEWKFLSGM